MKQYVKAQKNVSIVLMLPVLIMLSVFSCFYFLIRNNSILGSVLSCSILVLLIITLVVVIKLGTIMITMDGILIKEKRKDIFVSWVEFIDIKVYDPNGGGRGVYKFILTTSKRTFRVYNLREFVDKLIQHCSSLEFAEKLKAVKDKIDQRDVWPECGD